MSVAKTIAASVLLVSMQSPSDRPETPEIVYELAVDERFEPGDFSYLRGAYPGASEQEREQWEELSDWLTSCRNEARTQYIYDLSALGVELSEEYSPKTNSFCAAFITPEDIPGITEFSQIEAGLPAARLVYATLVDTLVEAYPGYGAEQDLAFVDLLWLERRIDLLRGVPGGPLVSRSPSGRRFPELDDHQNTVLQALISSELVWFDLENTDILKSTEKRSGWPTISRVGKEASDAALSVLERADSDPVFQVRSLRMLEPLAREGEVSGQYAVVYDRILLKLTGKQRFGTQSRCVDSVYQRYPLEEPDKVDEWRASLGLAPLNSPDEQTYYRC